MSSDQRSFDVVRRGYDIEQVEKFLVVQAEAWSAELELARTRMAAMEEELRRLREFEDEADSVRERLEAAESEREQASRLRTEILEQVNAESQQIRAEAQREAARMRHDAELARARIEAEARNRTTDQENEARRSSNEMVAEAERIRAEAVAEADRLRASANDEVDARVETALQAQEERLRGRHRELDESYVAAKAQYDKVIAAMSAKVGELKQTHHALITGLQAIARGGLSQLPGSDQVLPTTIGADVDPADPPTSSTLPVELPGVGATGSRPAPADGLPGDAPGEPGPSGAGPTSAPTDRDDDTGRRAGPGAPGDDSTAGHRPESVGDDATAIAGVGVDPITIDRADPDATTPADPAQAQAVDESATSHDEPAGGTTTTPPATSGGAVDGTTSVQPPAIPVDEDTTELKAVTVGGGLSSPRELNPALPQHEDDAGRSKLGSPSLLAPAVTATPTGMPASQAGPTAGPRPLDGAGSLGGDDSRTPIRFGSTPAAPSLQRGGPGADQSGAGGISVRGTGQSIELELDPNHHGSAASGEHRAINPGMGGPRLGTGSRTNIPPSIIPPDGARSTPRHERPPQGPSLPTDPQQTTTWGASSPPQSRPPTVSPANRPPSAFDDAPDQNGDTTFSAVRRAGPGGGDGGGEVIRLDPDDGTAGAFGGPGQQQHAGRSDEPGQPGPAGGDGNPARRPDPMWLGPLDAPTPESPANGTARVVSRGGAGGVVELQLDEESAADDPTDPRPPAPPAGAPLHVPPSLVDVPGPEPVDLTSEEPTTEVPVAREQPWDLGSADTDSGSDVAGTRQTR